MKMFYTETHIPLRQRLSMTLFRSGNEFTPIGRCLCRDVATQRCHEETIEALLSVK